MAWAEADVGDWLILFRRSPCGSLSLPRSFHLYSLLSHGPWQRIITGENVDGSLVLVLDCAHSKDLMGIAGYALGCWTGGRVRIDGSRSPGLRTRALELRTVSIARLHARGLRIHALQMRK